MGYTIGIDVGTSGTKVLLMDPRGQVCAAHTETYPMSQPQNGWAEQEPEHWWKAAVLGIRAVLQSCCPEDVSAIGLSGQMHGLVMLDSADRVLRPAILWCDQRTGRQAAELERRAGARRLLEISANPALTGFTAAKILWVQDHEPGLWEKCTKILLPKDYIRYRLTGEFAGDVSDCSGMQLMDVKHRCWSKELLEVVGVQASQLGTLVESVDKTGSISSSAAAETGLQPGTVVVGGAGDNAASAIGTGVVSDGNAFITIGTSGVLFGHTKDMCLDPGGRVHTMCAAVPGEYHVMGVTQAAGLSLQWLRNQCCAGEIQQAEALKTSPYVLMDQMASEIPPGADRLLYLPYLMGERTPHLDPDCRGVFFGLSNVHTRAHLIRAVMEGVSYSLKDCLDIILSMGISLNAVAVCGGGASSSLWRQILSDVCGIGLHTVTQTDGAAFGAAILAAVGCGQYSCVEEAGRQIVRTDKKAFPEKSASVLYQARYPLYKALYPALKDCFSALSTL